MTTALLWLLLILLIQLVVLEWWPVKWSEKINVGGWLYPQKDEDDE